MTTSLLFWIKLIVWLVVVYSIFTLFKSYFTFKRNSSSLSTFLKSSWADVIAIIIGCFALVTIEKNYQQPFNVILTGSNPRFPTFSFLETSSGSVHTLEQDMGELTIINYWATWCGPCRKEMPVLDSIQKKHAADGVRIIAVSDEEPDVIRNYMKQKNFSFASGSLTKSNNKLDSVYTRPVSILLDKKGRVIDMIAGSRGFVFFDNWIRRHK